MPIIDYLERNAREFGDDVALVEINPDVTETRRVTWREYELIEANPTCQYRSHGMYLTRKPIVLQIFWFPEESRKEIRSVS